MLLKSSLSHGGGWYSLEQWSLADLPCIKRWRNCDRSRMDPSLPGLETPSCLGKFPRGLVVKILSLHCPGPSSFSGQGVGILWAARHGKKKKRNSSSLKSMNSMALICPSVSKSYWGRRYGAEKTHCFWSFLEKPETMRFYALRALTPQHSPPKTHFRSSGALER